jgi:hypothetical protein
LFVLTAQVVGVRRRDDRDGFAEGLPRINPWRAPLCVKARGVAAVGRHAAVRSSRFSVLLCEHGPQRPHRAC